MLRIITYQTAFLIAFLLVGQAAQALTMAVDKDTYAETVNPTRNFGGNAVLRVSPTQRSFVHFDLVKLPSDVVITKAWLRIWTNNVIQTTPGVLEVFKITSDWDEAILTNNNAPTFDPGRVSAFVVRPEEKNQYIETSDITDLVKAWQSGTMPNLGLALVSEPTYKVNAAFDSKENATASHSIELILQLQDLGPKGNTGIPGIQGAQGDTGKPFGDMRWVTHTEVIHGIAFNQDVNHDAREISQSCFNGEQVYSGGYWIEQPDGLSYLNIFGNAASDNMRSWIVRYYFSLADSANGGPAELTVHMYALCGPPYRPGLP